jgi:hypothetical protein
LRNGRFIPQISARFNCAYYNAAIAPDSPKLHVPLTGWSDLQVKQNVVGARHELLQDARTLAVRRQANKTSIGAGADPLAWFRRMEKRDMKTLRIEANHNLARIAHLGIRQTFIGEAVD